MSDLAFEIPPPTPRASFHLDDAAGLQQCSTGAVEISERGLRFTCPWSFTIGTQLSVAVTDMHPRLGLCRMSLEGIVVWCEPRGEQGHETTLLFLEFPDEIRPSLREFSHLRMAMR
jgi:PilZ domain